MSAFTIVASTWEDGVFVVSGGATRHELADHSVRGLAGDGRGSVIAVVDGNSLRRRSASGDWTEIVRSEFVLSCCVAVGDDVFVGTDDARVLRVDARAEQHELSGFAYVPGREKWYPGGMMVDGEYIGPPLGVRSIAATRDGFLLANVHVGGIARSVDFGLTWQPTIDIDSDVHQVCAHASNSAIAIAASATGLCVSRDGGGTWAVESDGLHAPHCSGVAFGRYDIFVSASVDPFSAQGAVYRRSIDGDDRLRRLAGGMPEWVDGRVDTDCIATCDAVVALIDGSGGLYVSQDDGATWTHPIDRLPFPSGLRILPAAA